MSQQLEHKEEVEKNDEDQQIDQSGNPKLTKNQKKKLKEKAKKEQEKLKPDTQEQKPQEEVKPQQKKQEQKKDPKKKKEGKMSVAAQLALKRMQQQRQEREKVDKAQKEFEQKQRRLEQIEKEKERQKQQQKARIKQLRQKEKQDKKKLGLYVSKKHQKKMERNNIARDHFEKLKHEDESDEDSQEDIEHTHNRQEQPAKIAQLKPEQQHQQQKSVHEIVRSEVDATQAVADTKPKKKYVKNKAKTLEQVYEEAMKKKAAEAEAEKNRQLANVDNWEQLVDQVNSPQIPLQTEDVMEKSKTEEIKTEETRVEKQQKQKKDKKKKKKEKQIDQEQQKKKEQPQLQILVDQRKFFNVNDQQKYRSPICCILGHVDTGKTSILDKIRRTSVQQKQAGGITQQIGATFFPKQKLVQELSKCDGHYHIKEAVPGLLIIDTPGHESFSNLRSRGSSLCDIAILVIDLMHGLEKQTLQSIRMLTDRKTHFVVALNKIDRCFQWTPTPDGSSFVSLKNQSETTLSDYNNRLNQVKLQLNQQGFNIDMYWQNPDISQYVSLVPTSARTGEGLPDLMSAIVQECMSTPSIEKRLRINNKKFNCTVMEVKMIEGHGTTIDCILVDGIIHRDDQIVLLGFNGPIVTKVKALLTPHPMKEMRVKDEYIHHDVIQAANGIKIDAAGIDQAVAGTPLFVANTPDEVERAVQLCNNQYQAIKNKIKLSDVGVGVAASTLGSLEALLDYLSTQKIPVSYVSVGPVSKQDVMRAMKSLLSENPEKRRKEFCCVLVFDVKILEDAKKYAEENNIKVFWADIIYHLTDHFNKYVKEIREERKLKEGKDAIFPCVLKIVEIFRKSDPIVLGVDVEEGQLRVGTPIAVYNKEGVKVKVGIVQSIESNHKKMKEAKKSTGSVAISLVGQKINAGKDFEQADKLCSLISRRSIDCLKQHFRDQVSKEEWQLVIELKKYFHVQ